MNQNVFNAKVHLDVALRQSIDSDDQIIMNHVREAKRLLDVVKEGPPGTDLIDRAALLTALYKERDDYVKENGTYDPDTGFTEFGARGEEYYGEMCARIEFIENFPSDLGWQSIETAPKNKIVTVWFPSGEQAACYSTDHQSEIVDTWRYAYGPGNGTQAGWPKWWRHLHTPPKS